jgi:mannose-1-phosphate guanylyltransferase
MVVAAQHREWWEGLQTELPPENLIVQPHNRGTAHGILLPLLEILARDQDARVVTLPADHFVDDEVILAIALRHAAKLARDNNRAIYLLGIEPDAPDTEYGYIVPSEPALNDDPSRVLEFVEKPSYARAKALIAQGAVWNSFIMAASAWAFLRLFAGSFSSTIVALSQIAERRIHLHGETFDRLYERLPTVDFSKDVLPGHEEALQVLRVPPCGWNDLGTPHRLARTLQHLRDDWNVTRVPLRKSTYLSLAEQ